MSKRSLAALAALLAAACQYSPPPSMVSLPPALPPDQQLSPPILLERREGTPRLTESRLAVGEERVQVETYGRDVDVRDILTFLGQRAGIRFVFAPEINKKIRVSLTDVPLSEAIETVLAIAKLTVEGNNVPGRVPLATSVVFYELPVNVDSLSVDAIMKRFHVGRSVAEMLVESRTRRP